MIAPRRRDDGRFAQLVPGARKRFPGIGGRLHYPWFGAGLNDRAK